METASLKPVQALGGFAGLGYICNRNTGHLLGGTAQMPQGHDETFSPTWRNGAHCCQRHISQSCIGSHMHTAIRVARPDVAWVKHPAAEDALGGGGRGCEGWSMQLSALCNQKYPPLSKNWKKNMYKNWGVKFERQKSGASQKSEMFPQFCGPLFNWRHWDLKISNSSPQRRESL